LTWKSSVGSTTATRTLIRVLELNEGRLYAWPFLGYPTVVRDDLDRSIEYLKALRKVVRFEWPDYVSPYEAV